MNKSEFIRAYADNLGVTIKDAEKNFNAFLDSFYVMGMGMAGIFIVIVVLMLVLKGLTLLFPEKKDKNE